MEKGSIRWHNEIPQSYFDYWMKNNIAFEKTERFSEDKRL